MISGKKQKFVSLNKYNFNWRLFSESVPEEIFNLNDLTEAIKLKIESLSYVYGLNELMMKDVMIKSLNDNNQVDID